MKTCLVLAALIVAVPAAAAPADCPNQGLSRVPVTFTTAKGRFAYKLEVAATPAQQQCGLMFRRAMPRKVGMVFPFEPPRPASFWMENTPLPLDLVFVGPDSRVVSIGNGVPFSRTLIDSGGVTARVIELNAGEAERIGLKPGDKVAG
ncbi:DUF192 domain-containing protein [Polymorphobacter fuscus]|uniref:DUF192 domain-containing protein n=1 Tax=Sandarakinorhabdus fusca TaxID=1439888 RepID=A0A7C9KHR0_9SPHN|nr:DUF192 domain-containing protein [Polymorphobacter fuscus]KAB7649016.1 DUF192 domain-containing protein [Polymorphobacter fuscus]MQT16619.1 DUF192 domain-containing protein [Polymorphobacter fuscus]NJC07091.1 hypothetical protein [Polymorphobacter fuscus]